MATTTNYGWDTPDDTDLVKDGAAAIRTLGSSVDTTTKALNPSTTLGDLEYRSATANTNTRLAIGSTGDVLTVAGGVPTWAAAAGGGKVLQVVFASTNTNTTNSTNVYADTTLTGSITPSAATSSVLVLVTMAGLVKSSGNSGNALGLRVLRGGTTIHETDALMLLNNVAEEVFGTSFAANIVDSPATTSSTTYKVQLKNLFNGASVSAGYGLDNASTITLIEIGA
jgi:hypothetical protein